MYVKPTKARPLSAPKASVDDSKPVLPPAPSAPKWDTSEVIPNSSSTDAYALYSVANGKFVEGAGSHMMSPAAWPWPWPWPRPRPRPWSWSWPWPWPWPRPRPRPQGRGSFRYRPHR